MLPKNAPRLASDPRNRPTRRVLVVDDVPEIGALYRAIFRRVPSVHIVSCFEPKIQSAVARLKDERFDLVITDMRMPDGTGDQVIEAARNSLPACPVVLMTGYLELSPRDGLAASLSKPLDTEKVLGLLTELLSPVHADAQPTPGDNPHNGAASAEVLRRST